MLEMNKVMLIGNLTRDPELSYIANGTALAKLGLAVNRSYKKASGEYEKQTAFVDITVWRGTAEFCSKYLKKGKRVFIEGRLDFDSWEAPDGTKRNKLYVTADRVQFADSKPSDAQGGGQSYESAAPAAPQAPPPAQAPPAAPQGPSDESTADDLPF